MENSEHEELTVRRGSEVGQVSMSKRKSKHRARAASLISSPSHSALCHRRPSNPNPTGYQNHLCSISPLQPPCPSASAPLPFSPCPPNFNLLTRSPDPILLLIRSDEANHNHHLHSDLPLRLLFYTHKLLPALHFFELVYQDRCIYTAEAPRKSVPLWNRPPGCAPVPMDMSCSPQGQPISRAAESTPYIGRMFSHAASLESGATNRQNSAARLRRCLPDNGPTSLHDHS